MKYGVLTLSAVLAVAGATAALTYRSAGNSEVKAALSAGDALEWLRVEFALNEQQFAQIKALHEAYADVCADHCQAIQEATRTRNDLRQKGAEAGTLAAAEARLQELRLICETAIAAHVRQCAGLMAPQQGERYLALVLPKIADFDHQAPPNVRVSAHAH